MQSQRIVRPLVLTQNRPASATLDLAGHYLLWHHVAQATFDAIGFIGCKAVTWLGKCPHWQHTLCLTGGDHGGFANDDASGGTAVSMSQSTSRMHDAVMQCPLSRLQGAACAATMPTDLPPHDLALADASALALAEPARRQKHAQWGMQRVL